jgi:hypothetical protein
MAAEQAGYVEFRYYFFPIFSMFESTVNYTCHALCSFVFVLTWKIPMQTSLYASLLIGLAFAALLASQIPRATAQSATPTYVLGVSNPTDPLILDLQNLTSSLTILSSVSSLSLIGPNSILFVDGSWLQSASSLDPTILSSVIATALSGVPTVVVRGNPAFLQNSITGLLQFGSPNLPLIAEGVKIFGTLLGGTRVADTLQIIQGFDYAVQTEFYWAQGLLSQASTLLAKPLSASVPVQSTTSTSQPFWLFTGNYSVNTGNYYYPYGRVIANSEVYFLENSNSKTYEWFNFFLNDTIQPGSAIFNSGWRTDYQNSTVHVNNNYTTAIASHGPVGTVEASGPLTVTYSVGVAAGYQGGNVTSTQTTSYMLKHANITDTTQPSNNSITVGWINSIDPRSSSGMSTFQIIPGWTIRLLQQYYPSFQLSFATQFVQLSGSNIVGNSPMISFTEVVG